MSGVQVSSQPPFDDIASAECRGFFAVQSFRLAYAAFCQQGSDFKQIFVFLIGMTVILV
ncbi:MAG: hypothetical protein PUE99_00835 [Anaerovibrio sp.]|nr:hypothetical protein [Anaerovibrio sp.]